MLANIQKEFESAVKSSDELTRLREAIKGRTASYADAHRYAQELSKLCTAAIRKHMTADSLPEGKLFYNIAQKVMTPMLQDTRTRISRYCYEVQKALNADAGIGIRPSEPEFDEERLEGLIQHTSDLGLEDLDQALQFTESATETFDSSIVDDFVEENARKQAGYGLKTIVVRTANPHCCEWCAQQAGEYTYDGDSSHEYWKRHVGCTCTLSVRTERGENRTIWDPSIHRKARRRR